MLHLLANRQHRLEVRTLLLSMDDLGLNVLKTCAFEHLDDFDFTEAQPHIGVEHSCLLKAVLQQVEQDNASAMLEQTKRSGNGLGWLLSVVQCLTSCIPSP